MNNSFVIKNKVALVTGANRGIGKAIVEAFIDKGGARKIYAAVRDIASAQALVDQYKDQVEAIQIDLNKPETIAQAAKKATDVEVLVNNCLLYTSDAADE